MRIHIQKFLNNLYSFGLESVQLQTHLPSYLFHLSVQLVDYMLWYPLLIVITYRFTTWWKWAVLCMLYI